jgi:hypothetical protein
MILPDFTLTATPTSVTSGNASKLTWSAPTDATECIASATPASAVWPGTNSTSAKLLAGNPTTGVSTGALTAMTVYEMTCGNNDGTTTRFATVNIAPPTATCGTAVQNSGLTLPTTNLCGVGQVSWGPFDVGTTWSWTCADSTTNTTATCNKQKTIVNGSCGSANSTTPVASLDANSPNLCVANNNVVAFSGTGPWTWTCDGINGGTPSSQCSAQKIIPSTLRLCQNGFYYASQGSTGLNIALFLGESRNLTTYYDTGTTCPGTNNVTSSTSFASSKPTIGVLSGTDPKVLKADIPNASTTSGQQSDTSSITATYSGKTVTMPITVTENCVSRCVNQAINYCQGKSFVTKTSCDADETCTGTRPCDQNWKEVAPTGN